jgi:hypothetical protein
VSIASFEGKGMYRIDYTAQEVVRDGEITKEAVAFFIAESPEEALSGLREALAPVVPTIMNLTLAMEGENLKYKALVTN